MNTDSERTRHLEQMRQEHAELRDLLGQLRQVLSERLSAVAHVSDLLLSLSEHVESHFRDEENEGLFGEIVAQAPRLSDRADGLRLEHIQLLEAVNKLKTLAATPASAGWWEQLDSAFQEFNSELLSHERRENALLQEAFGEDIGSKD